MGAATEVIQMVEIVKRDGRREQFVPEKIVVSAIKSGAPPQESRTIAQSIEGVAHDGMSTQEIRRRVLEQLRAMNPEWEQSWLMYDRSVKKRVEAEPIAAAR